MQWSPDVIKAYELAKQAREKAYAPYSKFKVGAVVKLKDKDQFVTGHNIENASFPCGECAEPVALFSAISQFNHPKIEFMLVVGDSPGGIRPCGRCRQILVEFCDQNMPIYLADLAGVQEGTTLAELLPGTFSF